MRIHFGILSFQCRHFRIFPFKEDRPRLSRELFELANLVSSTSDLITLTLRTPCRLRWQIITWGRAGIPTLSQRTTISFASAIHCNGEPSEGCSSVRLQFSHQTKSRTLSHLLPNDLISGAGERMVRIDGVTMYLVIRRCVDNVSSFKLQLPRSTLGDLFHGPHTAVSSRHRILSASRTYANFPNSTEVYDEH